MAVVGRRHCGPRVLRLWRSGGPAFDSPAGGTVRRIAVDSNQHVNLRLQAARRRPERRAEAPETRFEKYPGRPTNPYWPQSQLRWSRFWTAGNRCWKRMEHPRRLVGGRTDDDATNRRRRRRTEAAGLPPGPPRRRSDGRLARSDARPDPAGSARCSGAGAGGVPWRPR